MKLIIINLLILLTSFKCYANTANTCDRENIGSCSDERNKNSNNKRYILYDVNPPEGFNLRRDVYLRMAVFFHQLKTLRKYEHLRNSILVLPPWPRLYHWQSNDIEDQDQVPWGTFFDIPSLQKFAPVIEMYQFFNEIACSSKSKYAKIKINEVITLQHYKDMFETGIFKEKLNLADCEKDYHINYYGYANITSENLSCISFHGSMSMLSSILEKYPVKSILFNHAEIPLHDHYGDVLYWKGRRSMRFNKELYQIARDFRKNYLNSTDEEDNTLRLDDWTKEKPVSDKMLKGGKYLCAHLRRKDFLWGRPSDVPSLKNAAQQINGIMKSQSLKNIFISTDAPEDEFQALKIALSQKYHVFKYTPDSEVKTIFKDGGVAIIDQIICSHAKFFIGTHESTFSYRIQEEREILGFSTETTFNRFCGDGQEKCSKPSIWKIVY